MLTGLLREAGYVRLRVPDLGRGEPGTLLQDVDVRGGPGDHSLLTRRAHLPQKISLLGIGLLVI